MIWGELFCKLFSACPKCNIHTSPISIARRHHRIMENHVANRKWRERKTIGSQLAKATEVILICPLNNPHCGNYCSQQIPVVGSKQILCLSVCAACCFVCLHKSLLFFYFLKIYISYGHQHLVSNFPRPVGLYWYIINKCWVLSQIVMHNIYCMVIWIFWNISI